MVEESLMRLSIFCMGIALFPSCSNDTDRSASADEASAQSENIPPIEFYPLIRVTLQIRLEPTPDTSSKEKLFLLGWKEIQEGVHLPPARTRPDFRPYDLTSQIHQGVVEIEEFELQGGLHYFAQYGVGQEPGPDFRFSATAQPFAGRLELVVTDSRIPKDPSAPGPE